MDLALELLDESLVDRCGHRTYIPGWRRERGERGCPRAGQLAGERVGRRAAADRPAVVRDRRPGSVGVESLEPCRDAGDELGVALPPVSGIAHHLGERVLAQLGGGNTSCIQQLWFAGAHHLV